MKMKYERILIYGLPRKVSSLKRLDTNQDVRISSLISGDTAFYKLIVSDTNVDIELSESFQLKWELQESWSETGGQGGWWLDFYLIQNK